MVHNPRTYVDLYCERLAPGLAGEPLNALSNAAFFIAAWLLARDARRLCASSADRWLLVVLIASVGVGSTTFHMAATTETQWLDVIPILLFQLAFLWIYAQRVLRWPLWASALVVAAFFAICFYARQFTAPLNGSLAYAPALIAVFALGIDHRLRDPQRTPWLPMAAAVFTVSLALRTIDIAACERFALGTHFLWHILNGVVVYLCGRSVLGTAERAH